MSARRRGRRARAATPPTGAPRRAVAAKRPDPAVDPLTVYREAAGYGRIMRTALALSLLLLALSLAVRVAGSQPPAGIGVLGAGLMLVFLSGGMVKHYRGLYRVRRYHPGAWQPSARFTAGMLKAPFGIGDPAGRGYDRAVLRATALLAGVLVALLIAVRALNR